MKIEPKIKELDQIENEFRLRYNEYTKFVTELAVNFGIKVKDIMIDPESGTVRDAASETGPGRTNAQ